MHLPTARGALLGASLFLSAAFAAEDAHLVYPTARKVDQVDEYHGVKVADPYRWLEDDNSEETKAWVEAENKVTFAYLEAIPERAALKERLAKLWNYERFGAPFHEGGRYFWMRNSGLQNQRVLYVAEKLDAAPRVLLDPNTLSTDGTVALAGYAASKDGKWLAYGLSRAVPIGRNGGCAMWPRARIAAISSSG